VYLLADERGSAGIAEQQAQRRRQAGAAGGTTRGSARDRLLAAAAECFYNHGVNGTGIDATDLLVDGGVIAALRSGALTVPGS